MHKALIVFVALGLAGCSMTPTQKKIVAITASAIITGVIISRDDGNSPVATTVRTPGTDCQSEPQSCR